MNTLELLQEYLRLFFEKRDTEKLLLLLTEDIHCYGFAGGVTIENIEDGRRMLASGRYERFMEYTLELHGGEQIDDESAVQTYSLRHDGLVIRYRLVGNSRKTESGRRLCLLNFCVTDPELSSATFEEILHKRQEKTVHSVLKMAMPGGIMGGYNAPGYPFYCINENMLQYLGYADEREFIRDTGGLVENGIHPDDRERVNAEVSAQLAASGAYQTEYRMRKKDGGFIWVHDAGKCIKAADGRDAIVSACYDITKEKEHAKLLDGLVNSAAGGMATFRVEKDWRMTPLFVSSSVGAIGGYSESGYSELCGDDAMQSIFEEDRPMVMASIREAVLQGKITSQTYRIPTADGGCRWINGLFSGFGTDGDRPVMRAVFTPVSIQYDLQLQALNQGETGVCIIDADTSELYYANNTAFVLHGAEPCNYSGKTCSEAFCCEHPQKDCCWLKSNAGEKHAMAHCKGRTLSISFEEREWNGHRVIVVYQRDISEQLRLQQRIESSNRELEREKMMLQSACDFAHVWAWVYHIQSRDAKTYKLLQTEFGFPEIIHDFPECIIERGIVMPDHVQLCRDKLQAIKNGSGHEEFEIKVRYKNGEEHWCRVRVDRVAGENDLAICTAQLMDEEKVLAERVALQKQKVLSSDTSMRGYAVVNVTKNEILECEGPYPYNPPTRPGATLETGVSAAEQLLSERELAQYRELHDREKLLEKYRSGVTTFEFEGRHVLQDGVPVWGRSVFNLLLDPRSGDLLLYEYVYDIQKQKMLEEILTAAVTYDYERVASVTIPKRRMTVVDQDNPNMFSALVEWDYDERSQNYGKTVVLPADREMFLEHISLQRIAAELDDKDRYEFVHRITQADGSIGYRRNRFSYYNRELGICLMTRTDVTTFMQQEEQKSNQLSEALCRARLALLEKEKATQDRDRITTALFSIIPMVISSNITQSTYEMLNYDNYTTKKARTSGSYDELIRVGIATVPDEDKAAFEATFCRENVLRAYENGEKSVSLEHRQMGDDGVMRWIDTRCVFASGEGEEDLYTITLARDVTQRKQTQLALQEALETANAATKSKANFCRV